MKEIIAKLADFKDLSSAEMTDVIERIVTGQVEESQIAAFLLGLKMKGETIEERTALACLLYTSPSPRDVEESRMPSSA